MEYSKEQIEQMPAGRELDILVAEHVLGLPVAVENAISWDYVIAEPGQRHRGLSYYSAAIADAWEVVDKMRTAGFRSILMDQCPDAAWNAKFVLSGTVRFESANAPTVQLAICRAALLAVLERRVQP